MTFGISLTIARPMAVRIITTDSTIISVFFFIVLIIFICSEAEKVLCVYPDCILQDGFDLNHLRSQCGRTARSIDHLHVNRFSEIQKTHLHSSVSHYFVTTVGRINLEYDRLYTLQCCHHRRYSYFLYDLAISIGN